MKGLLRHILILVLFIQFAIDRTGAQPLCIPFEQLPLDTLGADNMDRPGDTLMTDAFGAQVIFDNFEPSTGIHQFFNLITTITPIDGNMPNAEGTLLHFDKIGLMFDFNSVQGDVVSMSFDYSDALMLEKNLQINGLDTLVFSDFEAINPDDLFNSTGVTIEVYKNPNYPQNGGTITLCGHIESLRIGGANLNVDNVCYELSNLTEVWPGDANANGRADHFDLLHFGLAFNADQGGCPRPVFGTTWTPFLAEDWFDEFANGLNFKHADANGDGVVDDDDTDVIETNFLETNINFQQVTYSLGTPADPPIFVDTENNQWPGFEGTFVWPNGEATGNPLFNMPIILGTDQNPVDSIYGVAFTLEFDPNFFDFSMVSVSALHPSLPGGASWLGDMNLGEVIEYVNTDDAAQGKIHYAVSRVDRNPISGQGQLAMFDGIIILDVVGFTSIRITDIKTTNTEVEDVWVHDPVFEFEVVDSLRTSIEEQYKENLRVFPNPAKDILYIENRNSEDYNSIKLYNTLGQLIHSVNRPGATVKLDVNSFQAGIYILEFRFDTQVVCKKIKIS